VLAGLAVWLTLHLGRPFCLGKSPESERLPPESRTVGADRRRNPFAPAESESRSDRHVRPIERFSLAQLRLVATADGIASARALIEDPDDLGFIVVVGDTIGAEHYTVIAIGDGELLLEAQSTGEEQGPRILMKLKDAQRSAEER